MINEKKTNKNKALAVCDLSTFLTLMVSFWFFEGKNGVTKYILIWIMIAAGIYFIGRGKGDSRFIEIYHLMYALLMVLVPVLTKDRDILLIHILLVLITLATRKVFSGCMIRDVENNKNNEKNSLSSNSFTRRVPWDVIFPLVGMISVLKLYWQTNIP